MEHLTPEQITPFVNPDISELARSAGIEPGELIGTGNGMTLLDDGLADYGPCGWCGMGHYIGSVSAGFGECDYCGAV